MAEGEATNKTTTLNCSPAVDGTDFYIPVPAGSLYSFSFKQDGMFILESPGFRLDTRPSGLPVSLEGSRSALLSESITPLLRFKSNYRELRTGRFLSPLSEGTLGHGEKIFPGKLPPKIYRTPLTVASGPCAKNLL